MAYAQNLAADQVNENVDCVESIAPKTSAPLLYDVYPYKYVTKKWSVSNAMNEHFNVQKKLMISLQHSEDWAAENNVVRFATAGDIMRIPSEQKQYVDKKLIQYLESFDVVLGNLETLVSANYPVPPESLFVMNSDPSVLTAFKRSDGSNIFSAVSFANNHTFDFPDEAIEDTLEYLDKIGVQQSGIQQRGIQQTDKPYAVIERNGVKVGYYALTTFVNEPKNLKRSKMSFNPILHGISLGTQLGRLGVCELDYTPIKSAFNRMEMDGIDVKVLSIHWGVEHDMYPQPLQMQVARELMRQGWDVIVGAHPHAPQPAEICFFNGYEDAVNDSLTKQSKHQCLMKTPDGIPRKSIVFYSLGNLTSYTPQFWQQLGMFAELTFEKSKAGESDWHSPRYTFTYDHTLNPPHGKQFLTFFSEQGVKCPWKNCTSSLSQFLGLPGRHMEGEGFTLLEQWSVTWKSSVHGIKGLLEMK